MKTEVIEMGKRKFYGIKKGKKVGVYETWEECKKYITGFKGAVFKGFDTVQEARAFIAEYGNNSLMEVTNDTENKL